jgi:glycosyltransferase involved in cell wall biosynthesis
MRWLVISPYLPHPRIGHGGGTAVLQLCEELARHHDTTLLCFQRETESGLDEWLRTRGVDVHTIPWRSDQARGLARIGLIADRARVLLAQQLHDRPFMVEKYDRADLRRAIDRILDSDRFDTVQAEYSFLAPAASWALQHPTRPAVLLNTHEIASLPRERELALARDPARRANARRALRRWIAHEKTMPESADRVLCVTAQDQERLAGILAHEDRLETVPLGYDIADAANAHVEAAEPGRLLFVGSFDHPPNAASARIFVDEILPLVHAVRPDLEVDIVGRGPADRIRAAAERSGGRIIVHGFVEDLDPLWRRSSIFVAPLFSGGGIKIKVLEAMSRGACVVSTPIGVEGIDDAGTSTLVAATPEELATGILELVGDPARRRSLGIAARQRIIDHFSWPSIVDRLTAIAGEVLASR